MKKILTDALKYIDFDEREKEREKLMNECFVNNSKRSKTSK